MHSKTPGENLKSNDQSSERFLDILFKTSPSFMVLISCPDFIVEKANDAYFKLVGSQDIIGKHIAEVRPEISHEGTFERLNEVIKTQKPYFIKEVLFKITNNPQGNAEEVYLDITHQPYVQDGQVRSILVQGNDVTEKVRARKSILESKTLIENERLNFRNLFKQTPEMVCILFGPDHIFEFVNEAHIKALGFDSTGMTVREAQPESVEVHDILDNVYKTGQTAELYEIPVTLATRVRYFNLTYAARRDIEGNINGVMVLGAEVTSEVLSRLEIQDARERLELALESGQMGTWEHDIIRQTTTLSPKAASIMGIEGSTFPNGVLSKLVHPDDQEDTRNVFYNSLQTRSPYLHEYRVIRPDGELRWIYSRGKAVFDDEGSPLSISGVSADITDRKLAVRAISESRERYKILFNISPLPKWIFDLETYKFLDVNATAIRHYGYTREEFLSMKITDLYPKEDIEKFYKEIQDVNYSEKNHRPYDHRHLKKDGTLIYVKVSAIGMTMFNSKARFDAVMDITERVMAEREQYELLANLQIAKSDAERAREEAEKANESKTRFLANMSHEIRTPLAAILGFSDLLQGRTKEGDAEAAKQLERISRNAFQLGRLIDELLDLSKIEAEKFEIERTNIDLHAALEDALSSVSIHAKEKGLVFEQSSVQNVPRFINTDAMRFRQVLINVIGNAVKFTEKGRISVEFEQMVRAEKRLLNIRVRDTGIGLSPEQQSKIFEPFVQADTSVTRKYGGTGLGLVLSKRLARLMGGDLILEKSALGEGSSFVITIDAGSIHQPTFVRAKNDEVSVYPSDQKALEGRNVLIVDDSPDNQMIIKLFLKAVGANIEIANHGLEAVDKMKNKNYDMVLMDIQMPIMDGYQALKVAQSKGYKGPIMALTAHALKDEKIRCLEAGFTEYLSKPINRTTLVQRISELIV